MFEPINPVMANNPESQAELFSALVKTIGETQDVHADATNPFHKNKYATLSAHLAVIKPIFAKHGLAIIQFPIGGSYNVGVRSIVLHKSGAYISCDATIPVPEKYKVDKETGEETVSHQLSGQEAGSIYSYLRRYSLASIAGCSTDDDDAETVRTKSTTVDFNTPKQNVKVIMNTPVAKPSQPIQLESSDIDPTMPVPFGNNKGTPIGELQEKDLKYWATVWEPRPFEKTGKVSVKDSKLKATAVALWNNYQQPTQTETVDEVPF